METTMKARVLRVCARHLLVCDLSSGQEVHVHTRKAHCFAVGDLICIKFNGVMTMSIPPQISADCIRCLHQ